MFRHLVTLVVDESQMMMAFLTLNPILRTAIAVKCKDGVVFAVEKMVTFPSLIDDECFRYCTEPELDTETRLSSCLPFLLLTMGKKTQTLS